jgi:flagellum-specific peptidoglycan hydrolase FlgJ
MSKNQQPAIKLNRIFLLIVILFSSFYSASAQSKYIKKYSSLADSLSAVYGIPAAVMLGIAIIESSSGTSRNCKLLNNHFGIVGRNKLLKTRGIRTRYKQYPDARSSYIDFCRLVTRRKFYSKLKGNRDDKLWIEAISKSNYSEAPAEWKKRVHKVIRKNKLSATK